MAAELQVISDFYDLMLYLSQRIEKFPRHHRYTLGAAIEGRLQAILGLLLRAKYSPRGAGKTQLLNDVNTELETLRFQIRLGHDLRALASGSHGHAVARLQQIGVQVGGWLKAQAGRP